MTVTDRSYLEPYRILVTAFVDGRLTGQEFQTLFLFMYQNDGSQHTQAVYTTLNAVFYEVEDFCADPALRSGVSLDEPGLRAAVRPRLDDLRIFVD